jgi:type IV pilus assembly protein PilC
MKRFLYKAKDKEGKLVLGEVEAPTINDAAKLVRNKKLYVISLKVKVDSPFDLIRRYRERISPSNVSAFTRQLATMINSGLPITSALLILRTQSNASMQKIISQVLADVEAGESLSNAMSRHPKVFSKTYVSLVKSGEVGGVMEAVLVRLADNLERQLEFNGKVKGALIYPVIIMAGMFVVGMIMMVFVIPRLLSLYTDFNAVLPLPTRILIVVSGFFVNFWWVILILIGIGLYAFSAFRLTAPGRRKTDEFIFSIPIFGELQKQIVLTELTRTLALMVSAGVPILEALNITADVVNNSIIGGALRSAAIDVERGFPIAYAFGRQPEAFPFILSQMIAVGEETGKMDEVLTKISHIFEVESDEKVKNLTAAIEPLVMVTLGLGVGFLVMAVILPIYNITSQF